MPVDLDQLPVDQRTSQLFTPDRVDLVKTPDAMRLQNSIGAMLNDWVELRDLNNELVRRAIQSRGNGRSTLDVAEKIRAQLAFRGGVAIAGADKDGDGPRARRKWGDSDLWPDPTTLEGPENVRALPGKTKFIHYQLNATNDFFASGRGTLVLSCDHPRIGDAELVAGGDLRGGMIRASLLVPDDVEVGTTATITAVVRDWTKAAGGVGGDLEWRTRLEVVDGTQATKDRKRNKTSEKTGSKGTQVAVLWRNNAEYDNWSGGVPGEVDLIEARVLAAEREEYESLASLGSEPVPTVVLNTDYTLEALRSGAREEGVGVDP